jgi:hypothetical protein
MACGRILCCFPTVISAEDDRGWQLSAARAPGTPAGMRQRAIWPIPADFERE